MEWIFCLLFFWWNAPCLKLGLVFTDKKVNQKIKCKKVSSLSTHFEALNLYFAKKRKQIYVTLVLFTLSKLMKSPGGVCNGSSGLNDEQKTRHPDLPIWRYCNPLLIVTSSCTIWWFTSTHLSLTRRCLAHVDTSRVGRAACNFGGQNLPPFYAKLNPFLINLILIQILNVHIEWQAGKTGAF